SYHMPWFEILSWVDRRLLHTKLLPHESNWPEPSISRALKLSAVQGAKLLFFLLLSAPMLVAVPLLLITRRRRLLRLRRDDVFFVLWIEPATLFYIFGHLGSWG